MVILGEFLKTLTGPDMVRITKDKEDLYVGYLGNITHCKNPIDEYMSEEVKEFRAIPEITHREWKERGLIAPLQPEQMPEMQFKDLQMTIYYTIRL